MDKMKSIQTKLLHLQQMNDAYVRKLKSLAKELKPKQIQIISYFTYSLNLSHEEDGENFIIGSFHVKNIGIKPLHNPFICLKLKSEDIFDFSGKYFYQDTQQNMQLADAWIRMNDKDNQEEFWLKPSSQQLLNPQETLTFQNFQLKWSPIISYNGSVTGFVYGDEIEDGVSALNQMSISGNVKEEDDYEK
ncbi:MULTISPECIES: hypothetical protein [Clostridia]|uniref:hypothetical protein n=1 Tax=Clostridia TaxID=186801 RepID=UPI000EA0FBA6|nr:MULTISPECIES: hypothetical protein [Clostridia]NBJ71655.1 hypothetical protein [Roseburia sp. 1XD42-34]RKI73938.1 hypothetical protein D7V87_19715 [Clostridium sp. 1xD42-85]